MRLEVKKEEEDGQVATGPNIASEDDVSTSSESEPPDADEQKRRTNLLDNYRFQEDPEIRAVLRAGSHGLRHSLMEENRAKR